MTLLRGSVFSLAALVAYIMALPHALLILLAVQILDVVGGICVAWGDRSVTSAICNAGIKKKVYAWIVILLVGLLQFELSNYIPLRVILNYTPMEVAALGFIVAESLSILEHGKCLGLALPQWLTRGLAVAGEKLDDNEQQTDTDNQADT